MQKYYAVVNGRIPGIYTNYEDAKMQIQGFSQAKLKRFSLETEAKAYYQEQKHKIPKTFVSAAATSKRKKKKYYAVRIGREPGVYESWEDCKKQTTGYPCAQYKSFENLEEAQKYAIIEYTIGSAVASEVTEVYTDGSCLDNQSRRSVGYACYFGEDDIRNYYGGQRKGSNNIAEITAVIKALEITNNYGNIIIYTDSTYVMQGIHSYRGIIESGDFHTLPEGLKNKELWAHLLRTLKKHQGSFVIKKVPAHSGVLGNERADQMAKMGALLHCSE
eukprot:NODE_222_length_13951_cov_0.396982.p7 type:complete len:275 gc:universal NODE_222_length_13951_cov_0.396982:7458-8282(+)